MQQRFAVLILVLVAQLGCATDSNIPLAGRTLFGPQLIQSWRSAGISDEDSAEILKLSLALAVVDRKICDMHLEPDPIHIFVYTEARVPIPLPVLEGVTFSYVTPQYVRHRLRAGRGLGYLKVTGESLEDGLVLVSIDRVFPVHDSRARRPPEVFICSVTIELRRETNGWSARYLGGVVA